MKDSSARAIRSPLQLFGLYLAWAESAMGGSLFALQSIEHWVKYFLIFSMGVGMLGYVGVAGFLIVYLVIKKTPFLFNPSDYDKSVQSMLFGPQVPEVEIFTVESEDPAS